MQFIPQGGRAKQLGPAPLLVAAVALLFGTSACSFAEAPNKGHNSAHDEISDSRTAATEPRTVHWLTETEVVLAVSNDGPISENEGKVITALHELAFSSRYPNYNPETVLHCTSLMAKENVGVLLGRYVAALKELTAKHNLADREVSIEHIGAAWIAVVMWLWSEADDARIFDLAAKLGKPVPGSRLPIISPSVTMGVPFFVAHGFGGEILIEDLHELLAFVSSEPTVPHQVAPRVDPVSAVLDAEGLVSPFNEGLRKNIIEQLRLQALLWCRSHQLVDGEEMKTLATRDLQWDEFTLGRTWTGYSWDAGEFCYSR